MSQSQKKSRNKLYKTLKKVSAGLTGRLVDMALIGVYFFEETAPYSQGTLGQKMGRIEKRFGEHLGKKQLKRAAKYAQKKGWLSESLQITDEGQKRLKYLLPQYSLSNDWKGTWYIVAYDIPENMKKLRRLLRGKLRDLGFGQLHKSLWISPFDFLGDIEKIVTRHNLDEYVVLAVSEKLGTEPPPVLTERVWGLQELNRQYTDFINKVKNQDLNSTQARFCYLGILRQDPQLPPGLLPEYWQGEVAYKIYKEIEKSA